MLIADHFSTRKKKLIIILIIVIILSSLSLFFFLQSITEENIRKSIFNKFRDDQIESTRVIGEHISSDLKFVTSILQGIADLVSIQTEESNNEKLTEILTEKLSRINNITNVNGIYVINDRNIIKYEVLSGQQHSMINQDLSNRDHIKEIKNNLKPIFSNGFTGPDNIYTIALAVPILNRDNTKYIGAVEVKIPTESFFEHYGNIHDINSQFLVVYDKRGNMLAVGADKKLLGENFFNETVQNFTNRNKILLNNTLDLLQGKSGYAIYDYGRGERLTTTYPVSIEGKPEYFIQIVTPTISLYKEINDILLGEKFKTLSLLIGTIAAVAALIIFLIKWNVILNNEVRLRTKELEKSNKLLRGSNQELAKANEELKRHDKMQKEFIDVASHEIKTPVQAILNFSQLLKIYPEKQADFIESLQRNANKLKRLSNDLLDVTKIESKSLRLKKEVFNLNETILNLVKEYKILIENDDELEVKLTMNSFDNRLIVEADKERINGVVSNLLSNAIKFTKNGKVEINIKKKNENFVVVSVRDTGMGIDPEISEKLFSKFTTTSFQGIGLGLYISKNIIEAHGGKIWGENNMDDSGGGATFYFTLPLRRKT